MQVGKNPIGIDNFDYVIVGIAFCVKHSDEGANHDVIVMHCPLLKEHMLIRTIVMHVHNIALVSATVPADLPARPMVG